MDVSQEEPFKISKYRFLISTDFTKFEITQKSFILIFLLTEINSEVEFSSFSSA